MALKKSNEKQGEASAAELRNLGTAELEKKLAESREELMHARFKHATAALEKTSEIKSTRKRIARILTVLNEKRSPEHADA